MGHAMKHMMSARKVKTSEPSSHCKAGKKFPRLTHSVLKSDDGHAETKMQDHAICLV